jgi:NAD(P)-dependent dehydrogenase (short-subunit alcohol dehydrogenase family)
MLLAGKVIIVTGVGPGMGSKLCRVAAAEGAAVAVSARSAEYVGRIVDQIRGDGGQAIGVPTDVSDEQQCLNLTQATLAEFGRIDGLVNSARARSPHRTLEETDLTTWPQVMDVTCLGALRMSLAVLPAMKARHNGAIVNVGTIATVRPSVGEADYMVAKAGLGGLSRQMATEFGQYNVRVNHARMGWLWGASIEKYLTKQAERQRRSVEELKVEVAAQIPLGLIPPDDECAKSVLFLVSDYARMVTGATLDINGGMYMPP